jgi:hypothetical protein
MAQVFADRSAADSALKSKGLEALQAAISNPF